MNSQTKVQSIHDVIHSYANTLNSADAKSIGSFYTQDGLLFPNGYGAVSKAHLDTKSTSYLSEKKFNIAFDVKDVVIKGDFAFVQAVATATTRFLDTDREERKTTRDFFVLQHESGSWKIFRYMFNNVR
jgi:ketosteroid isomerase-like protein